VLESVGGGTGPPRSQGKTGGTRGSSVTPASAAGTRRCKQPFAGGAGFAVTVASGGAPVESALVVAMKAGEDYRAVRTNAAGQAWVPFLPSSTGQFSLTVSAPNAIAFEDSLSVTAAAAARFRFASLTDTDAVHGDGDGRRRDQPAAGVAAGR